MLTAPLLLCSAPCGFLAPHLLSAFLIGSCWFSCCSCFICVTTNQSCDSQAGQCDCAVQPQPPFSLSCLCYCVIVCVYACDHRCWTCQATSSVLRALASLRTPHATRPACGSCGCWATRSPLGSTHCASSCRWVCVWVCVLVGFDRLCQLMQVGVGVSGWVGVGCVNTLCVWVCVLVVVVRWVTGGWPLLVP